MNRACCLWTLGAVLAIASVKVVGQGPRAAERGSVSGTVINHFTGAPLRDVAVTLKPETGSGRTVLTDPNGHFAMVGLPIGRYSVSAARDGFFRARYGGGPAEISLGSGQNGQDIRLQMIDRQGWTLQRTPDGQPDLEGYWYSDTLTPMERPPEFADKEFFTEQEAGEFARRAALRTFDDRGALPAADLDNNDGNQFWYDKPATLDSRRTSLIVDPPDGRVPAFTPEALQQRNAFLAARERAEGPESRDRGERCLGLTVVRRLSQILQAPGYVVILRESFANLPTHADIIPLNERPPLPPQIRQWDGDSRGHWEGDTLVVETANLRNEAGLYARQLPNANPRVVERYTRIGPDTILWEVTTDSSSFTKPFTYQIQLKRTKGPMLEFACHEGNYSMANILAAARATEKKTGATITGRVLDASGQPMPNANVAVVRMGYHRDGYPLIETISNTRTNERGEYQISPVQAGEYYLRALVLPGPGIPAMAAFYPGEMTVAAATPIVVRESEKLRDIDIGIRSVKAFKLRGQVSSSAPPVEGPTGTIATLGIVARDANISDDFYRSVGRSRLDTATGEFEIENILPGVYDLYAQVPDHQNWLAGGARSAVGRIPIEVRDRDVEGISISIHPSVEVKGTVSYVGGALNGNSLRVGLQADGSSAKHPVYAEVAQRPVTVESDRSFSIPGVPAGHFRMATAGLPPDAYVADVRRGNISVYDSGFELGAVSTDPIQVIVNSGAGTIQGVVRNGAGKPVAFATVALAPEQKRRQNRSLYADTTSDSAGKFTISGIAPGEYKLFAWEQTVWLGARQSPAFIAKYEELGRPVKVAERGAVDVDVTAVPGDEGRPR